MSYFPHDEGYDLGTDADHLPVVPSTDFPSDASQQDQTHSKRKPASGDAETYQGK